MTWLFWGTTGCGYCRLWSFAIEKKVTGRSSTGPRSFEAESLGEQKSATGRLT